MNVVEKPAPEIEIIDFSEDLAIHFNRLGTEWLEKYFVVEEKDALILSDPKKYIIDKGGFIFFAKWKDDIVGTVALMKMANGEYELAKMGVTPYAQGLGIGEMLMVHCIEFAKKMGLTELTLYSNTGLKPALHIYRKYGFEETTLEKGGYERCDIKMVKKL